MQHWAHFFVSAPGWATQGTLKALAEGADRVTAVAWCVWAQ